MVAFKEGGLLPDEDPESPHVDDAIHWITVYRELLEIVEHARAVSQRHADSDTELEFMDHDLLRLQAERYAARLQFWIRRAQEFGKGRPKG